MKKLILLGENLSDKIRELNSRLQYSEYIFFIYKSLGFDLNSFFV